MQAPHPTLTLKSAWKTESRRLIFFDKTVQTFLVCSFCTEELGRCGLNTVVEINHKQYKCDNFRIILMIFLALHLQVENTEEAFEGALKAAGLL